MMQRLGLPIGLVLMVWVVFMSGLVQVTRAQNQTQPTPHPDEARALNTIFAAWNTQAPREWNVTGELCSGHATNESVSIHDSKYNPLIKGSCSFVHSTINSTICRITALKVYAMDVIGPIPEELWSLVYLTSLNIGQNFLTGSLSPAIGNLTRIQYLTFGINALSGLVPKEIGRLTDLRALLSLNDYSGSLPPEIGHCLKLQQIYIDSSGLSGEIPSTFANLLELERAWIADVQFTGQIPAFIGNWSKLTTLRIFGTNLSGPIPSSFANLTSLRELRLGDISNCSSSLEFIRDMKYLSVLVLRNNNITGTIPSHIGEYLNLQLLFLGNNKLNGSLPAEKSRSLSNIDVSYNDLAGRLPSWINTPNLQLVLPGLNCLQKNLPCNRGKEIHFDFSINCGGPQMSSTSGTVYEKEDATLGPASFFVSNPQRWAVSNVGLFAGSNNNQYIASSLTQFVNTLDLELFQTARLSASSLRYYGSGLKNGGYTVMLQFAEIQIQCSNTWRGFGRRLFDIYVQGRLEKDFDIYRTANGSNVRVVQNEYKANVSENYLEIHLFWAGKGTCCIPVQGTYGPLVSAISATADFTPTVNNRPPSKDKDRIGVIVGIVVGVGVVSILAIMLIFIIRKRRKRHTYDEELFGIDIKPYTFSYYQLRSATQDFDPSNKVGEGGFGPVYKGKLDDGREITVKQLSVASRQGKGQFVMEIATISAVQHRNLVKFYGCCTEGDWCLLLYEYFPNKSLDQALFEPKILHLDWSTRFEMCLGVARGLACLHEESRFRIVHRDVKASNIPLDSNLVPKISDFGLAKLYDDKKTHTSTRVAGTIGNLAPEYAMRGHLTEKFDVFAFGIVALEIISGRPNSDQDLKDERKYLLEWAWNLHENNREVDLVDSKLTEFNEEEMKCVIGVALLCTQTSHALRPPMSRVVAMFYGDVEVSVAISKPVYLTDWRFEDITSFVSEEETKITGHSETHPNSSNSTLYKLDDT